MSAPGDGADDRWADSGVEGGSAEGEGSAEGSDADGATFSPPVTRLAVQRGRGGRTTHRGVDPRFSPALPAAGGGSAAMSGGRGQLSSPTVPHALRALVRKQQAWRDKWATASEEEKKSLQYAGGRPPPYQGSTYRLSRAALNAEGELTTHLTRLPRAVEMGLFCPQHEDRLLTWFSSTFQDAPYDVLAAKMEIAEETPSKDDRVGENSVLYRALFALIQHYARPHAAKEMRQLVDDFVWCGSVADTRLRFEELWSQAEVTASNTADFAEINKYERPAWGAWLRDVLRPSFPAWAETVAVTFPEQFSESEQAWACLHSHEPPSLGLRALSQPPVMSMAAADFASWMHGPAYPGILALPQVFNRAGRLVNCFRCGANHYRSECQAAKSAQELAGQDPPWPLVQPHPAQSGGTVRPAAAPVPYARPGPYGAPNVDAPRHVSALPAVAGDQEGRIAALEDTMSALLDLQERSAVGGSVQALSSPVSPPVRLGASDPGSGYVAVPSGVPVWLPAELAAGAVSAEVSGGAAPGAVLSLSTLSAGGGIVGSGDGEEALDPWDDDRLAPTSPYMPRRVTRE